jgi:TatD DNase family protein
MELIDTHTHLYLPEFDSDRHEMVERAVSSGVTRLLMPNIDASSIDAMVSAADSYKNACYIMLGLHPTSVRDNYLQEINEIKTRLNGRKIIAIGEVGIDLYWDKSKLMEQMEAFSIQIAMAIESDLPLVIHSRESFPEVFAVLDRFAGERMKGVFHAFSGTITDARKTVAMGFMLGIGGPVTFKNSKLVEVVKEIGIENIVLETDSPYLAPVPYRGKRNESSYIRIINQKIAEIFSISEEESAVITYGNSCRLFNI